MRYTATQTWDITKGRHAARPGQGKEYCQVNNRVSLLTSDFGELQQPGHVNNAKSLGLALFIMC